MKVSGILDLKNSKIGIHELKSRLLFIIGAIIIFRIGSFIPIPGIDVSIISDILEKQKGTIIEMFNMFSGGALSRASIFALGIMPYVSASIIIQILTVINPYLSEIKKEGESGRKKINQYTRYTTLILAIVQSIGISTSLSNFHGSGKLVINPNFTFYFIAVISLVCGTMFLMWLGEQITERGIGNGISIIIFSGIVSGLPSAVGSTIEQTRQGELHISLLLCTLILIFIITFFVVFIERGQRRINVNYARRQQGRRIYSMQSTHLPLKINMAGVIPAIFASSIILFPATIASWFSNNNNKYNLFEIIAKFFSPNKPLYIVTYISAIVFFCFFYTSLIFNYKETAENLKKSGAFITGIRPGEQTAKYINKIITRLTLLGSLYITFICLVPECMRNIMNVPFHFGGTSLLIVVVVIMDFIVQIQTIIMSNQYDLVFKKNNLKKYNS